MYILDDSCQMCLIANDPIEVAPLPHWAQSTCGEIDFSGGFALYPAHHLGKGMGLPGDENKMKVVRHGGEGKDVRHRRAGCVDNIQENFSVSRFFKEALAFRRSGDSVVALVGGFESR
jgi:hypothetical protein